MSKRKDMQIIGWREWVALPDLGIKAIKAKVDTGARSSSLHAYDVETFRRRGKDYVRFKVHPEQRSTKKVIAAEAPVLEYREVRSSSGQVSRRPVILTTIDLLDDHWDIELTLANRDEMGFRMLLGREAFRGHFLVDAGNSYYGDRPESGKKKKKKKKKKARTVHKENPRAKNLS